MVGKIGKKSIGFVLIIGVLLTSMVFGVLGGVKAVQAVGGAYSIVFRAGDTDDYIPDIPYPGSGLVDNTVPPVTVGRIDGNTVMDNDADYQGDPSLQPSDMARCQIVPYFFYITVNGDTTPENGSIFMKANWGSETTSGSEYGFNKEVMIYSAFVDTSDPSTFDPGLNATVAQDWDEYWIDSAGIEVPYNADSLINPGLYDDAAFEAVFQVDGLDDGDAVVVEVWVVLDCAPRDGDPKITGNIQVALEEAYTNYDPPDTISTGQQTNPITSAGDFQPAPVELYLIKADDGLRKQLTSHADGLYTQPWMNEILVNAGSEGDDLIDYVANEVVVTDVLDPYTQLISDDPYDATLNPFGYTISNDLLGNRTCWWMDDDTDGLGGIFSCDLVQMAEGDGLRITYWVKAVSGVQIGSVCEGSQEALPGTLLYEECLPTYLSPRGYDVGNSALLNTVSEDINDDNNFDEEPKDIIYPNAVNITSFTGTAAFKSVLLEWTTLNEDEALIGYDVYVSASEDGIPTKVNDALIPPDLSSGGAGVYEFPVLGAKHHLLPFHTYFFWLAEVNDGGYTSFHEPIEVTITPPGKNK